MESFHCLSLSHTHAGARGSREDIAAPAGGGAGDRAAGEEHRGLGAAPHHSGQGAGKSIPVATVQIRMSSPLAPFSFLLATHSHTVIDAARRIVFQNE